MTDRQPSAEPIIEPELPIVDAHHHLWVTSSAALARIENSDHPFADVRRNNARYLLDELLADINTGHNVRATVFVECGSMYRIRGPESLKSIGEIEFANGVAAMAESGDFGDVKTCAGIVGHADLGIGSSVEEVLEAHIRAGGGRYRGVRILTAHDSDPKILGNAARTSPHMLLEPKFRAGFKCLQKLGLSFDAWAFEPQLPDVIDLARSFPETQIVLDHVGTPLGIESYRCKRDDRFRIWRDNIRTLATCSNVAVKLGGLGMPFPGFLSWGSKSPATSAQLATDWKPYIEVCIEAFGVDRCMFESNFPVDSGTCTYPVLWNAFKRTTAGASNAEKFALFSGTAIKVYRLDL